MTPKIYNTLTRRPEEFKPIKKGRVGLYTCGPTVYNYAHIGNLRTYVFEDILKRVLRFDGLKVKHVMNITDVGHLTSDSDEGEDKMEKGARREHKSAWEIAEFYTAAFKNDLRDLNILKPDIWCRATDHIKEQIKLIKKLEKKGFTYRTLDGIYFDTARLPDYGALANLKHQELKAGARVAVGGKKNITDFALWKFSPANEKRQMEWKSPWGTGFPGWHIECSAMSEKYLGVPFDIHCGGIDHVPVHHTNEIAQTSAAEGKPLAHYWMHGEFLLVDSGDKMAKSGENFITLQTLKEKGLAPLAYRYFLLQTHYRRQLSFSWEALAAAQTGLEHLYEAVALINEKNIILNSQPTEKDLIARFTELINADLNTPEALALIWEKIKTKQISQTTVYLFDEVLGLDIKNQVEKIKNKPAAVLPENVKLLIAKRNAARAQKDWKTSDDLRRELEALGYKVEDAKNGTQIQKI